MSGKRLEKLLVEHRSHCDNKKLFYTVKLKLTIFYIKMKIRAGGGSFRAGGGALGQQGAPPCYSSLWETLKTLNEYFCKQ